jgi:hypothetical protein
MPPLTRDELINLNPQSIYKIKTFVLNVEGWSKLNYSILNKLTNPQRFFFDDTIIQKLPNTKGIYFFIVEPDFKFLPNANYLMYVGKVEGSNTFKKRFYDYVNSIGKKDTRRNIQLLTNLWPENTWVYVFELTTTDDMIVQIEKNLFDSIIPPMNNKFSAKIATKSRSIYS